MRRIDFAFLGVTGALLAVAAIPVVAQKGGPESILPPGFGEPTAPPEKPAPSEPAKGAKQLPYTLGSDTPASSSANGENASTATASSTFILPDLESGPDAATNSAEADVEADHDLPPTARRSLAQIGPLTPSTGGVSVDAFGRANGRFLAGLMRASHAPFVSRWMSITLRRVLLSSVTTPGDVNGADLTAERAALLLRMGEADAARLMVQSIDTDNFTPRLYAVAMQTYMATADPAGLCPLLPAGYDKTRDPHWQYAQAFCASFSGDQGQASSVLNQVRRTGRLSGIDYRLTEKTVGAGPSSRRSVRIEWDSVGTLDPWRFGLATATNVDIPAALYATVGDRYRAWAARSPTLSLNSRLPAVLAACRLGVFSGAAAVDYFSQLGDQQNSDNGEGDAAKAAAALYSNFSDAYQGETLGARVNAMRGFWTTASADGSAVGPGGVYFGALSPLARAAAALPPTPDVGADMPWILGAMFTAGYDRNAMAWVRAVDAMDGDGKDRAWAMLAVGLPRSSIPLSNDRIDSFVSSDESADHIASRMLVAALVGLDRMSINDAKGLSEGVGELALPNSRWADALAIAADEQQKGTVVLLAAVGMQARDWASLPPGHLAAILQAFRKVGLDAEARMIAAEAMTRV